MIAIVLAATMMQAIANRPPRPTDEALLATVRAVDPTAEILDHSARDGRNPRDGMRLICGRVRIRGQVEPFRVLNAWDWSGSLGRVIIDPVTRQPPLPVEPDHWEVTTTVPKHADEDGDGVQSLTERNADAHDRMRVLQLCRDLTPPEGTVWATEEEQATPSAN